MRCRNILDIDNRFLRLTLFFLLHLLLFWKNPFQIRHIHKMNSRRISKLTQIKRHVVHGIKALLHTVLTHANVVWKVNHLPRNALRSVTHETIFFITLIIADFWFIFYNICFSLIFFCKIYPV